MSAGGEAASFCWLSELLEEDEDEEAGDKDEDEEAGVEDEDEEADDDVDDAGAAAIPGDGACS